MSHERRLEFGKVGRHQPIRQFLDAGAVIANRHDVCPLLERRQRVGDRHPALARLQHGVVVLRVSDRDHVVRRQPEVLERRLQARRLVHARRQHHHRVFVEDHLELEPEVLDGAKDLRLLGTPGGDDHAADVERRDAALPEPFDEGGRRRLGQPPLFAACRIAKECPVLGDHAVEQIQAPKHRREVFQPAAGDEEQLAARRAHPFERRDGGLRHAPVVRKGAVVVAGESDVTHGVPASGRREQEQGQPRYNSGTPRALTLQEGIRQTPDSARAETITQRSHR